MSQQKLAICPITLKAANAFVGEHHRHHKPSVGHKFSIGVEDETGRLRGVAICGRPVARGLDNGRRLEVIRVATDGCENACSALYGAAARVGTAMGYACHDIFTYILESEPGVSLKAAGWVLVAETAGGEWDTPTRRRGPADFPTCRKQRWHATKPQEAT